MWVPRPHSQPAVVSLLPHPQPPVLGVYRQFWLSRCREATSQGTGGCSASYNEWHLHSPNARSAPHNSHRGSWPCKAMRRASHGRRNSASGTLEQQLLLEIGSEAAQVSITTPGFPEGQKLLKISLGKWCTRSRGTRAPPDSGQGLPTEHAQGLPGKLQPSPPAFVAAATPGSPDPQSKLGSKDENSKCFLH